tara:strand:- start:5807 stop:7603 length:1797 start_codon:yes stop_codon:yes gene_type:complete
MANFQALAGAPENMEAVNRRQFAHLVLMEMGINPRAENTGMLMRWMQMEFSKANMDESNPRSLGARFNPMATTHGWDGTFAGHTPTAFNDNNGQSVQHYDSLEMGVRATAETLNNGNYKTIVSYLARNAPLSDWKAAIANSGFDADGKPTGGLLHELNTWGGLVNSVNNYDLTDVDVFEDAQVFSGELSDNNTFQGTSKSSQSSRTFSRIPSGYKAYKVNGKKFLVYDMVKGRNVKIAFQHTGSQAVQAENITSAAWNAMSADYVQGGTTEQGLFINDSINNGTRSFDDITEGLLFAAGLYGTDALESDEVMAVIAEFIGRPDMSDDELTGRLQETDWWDQTTASQREWNDLSTADQIKAIKDNAQVISGLWTAYTGEEMDWMGFDTDGDGTVSVDEIEAGNSELGEWARKLSTGEVSQQTIVLEWIRPAALEIDNSPANRIIIEEEQAQNERGYTTSENKKLVADLWERYGLDISDADASGYADQLYMQEKSLADFEETAKGLSDVRWAGKPEGVDFETWSKPYATTYSNLLEVGEPTFRDENFTRFLDDGVGAEGGMNMYDFKKSLRQDARWANTQNAKAAASQTLGLVGRTMGFG